MKIVEGGHRGGDQCAGADTTAGRADHDAEAIVLAEAFKEFDEPHGAASDRDLERRTAQLS
jgi:hypothetical protein